MKWIILAGSRDTRKTWTLTEVVITLVNTFGAKLVSPQALPTPNPAMPPNVWPYYNDDTYVLKYRSKLIVVKTDGDMSTTVDEGFNIAQGLNADILISASRARSRSSHIKTIDNKISSKQAEVYVIAALDHSNVAKPAVVNWRVQQIINML